MPSPNLPVPVPAGSDAGSRINGLLAAMPSSSRRVLELDRGTHDLDHAVTVPTGGAGICIRGVHPSETVLYAGTLVGGADDPQSAAVRAVGQPNAAKMSTTMTAFSRALATSVTVANPGTIAAGDLALVSGANVDGEEVGIAEGAGVVRGFAAVLDVVLGPG